MAKKIGIMGGTFNPIHNGHLALAEHAYREYFLDEVVFIPSGKPFYKTDIWIASDKDRLEMVLLAIEDKPYFSLCTMEIERPGNTYTIDTMEQLQRENREDSYYFLIGADSLLDLKEWYRAEELLKITKFIVATRNHANMQDLCNVADQLTRQYGTEFSFLNMPNIDISSTDIRGRLKEGKSVTSMLPKSVEEYIQRYELYL